MKCNDDIKDIANKCMHFGDWFCQSKIKKEEQGIPIDVTF